MDFPSPRRSEEIKKIQAALTTKNGFSKKTDDQNSKYKTTHRQECLCIHNEGFLCVVFNFDEQFVSSSD